MCYQFARKEFVFFCICFPDFVTTVWIFFSIVFIFEPSHCRPVIFGIISDSILRIFFLPNILSKDFFPSGDISEKIEKQRSSSNSINSIVFETGKKPGRFSLGVAFFGNIPMFFSKKFSKIFSRRCE